MRQEQKTLLHQMEIRTNQKQSALRIGSKRETEVRLSQIIYMLPKHVTTVAWLITTGWLLGIHYKYHCA